MDTLVRVWFVHSHRLGGRPGDYDYRLGFRAEEVCHIVLCLLVIVFSVPVIFWYLHDCVVLVAICSSVLLADTYRKNSNIIRTIFTNNRGLIARVRIIHVN